MEKLSQITGKKGEYIFFVVVVVFPHILSLLEDFLGMCGDIFCARFEILLSQDGPRVPTVNY